MQFTSSSKSYSKPSRINVHQRLSAVRFSVGFFATLISPLCGGEYPRSHTLDLQSQQIPNKAGYCLSHSNSRFENERNPPSKEVNL